MHNCVTQIQFFTILYNLIKDTYRRLCNSFSNHDKKAKSALRCRNVMHHPLTMIQSENQWVCAVTAERHHSWLICIHTFYTNLFSIRNCIYYFMGSALLSLLWEEWVTWHIELVFAYLVQSVGACYIFNMAQHTLCTVLQIMEICKLLRGDFHYLFWELLFILQFQCCWFNFFLIRHYPFKGRWSSYMTRFFNSRGSSYSFRFWKSLK